MEEKITKPRGDSVLKTLPEDQQREIIDKIKAPKATYRKVREWLLMDRRISTSETALRDFYSWWHLQQRWQQASERGRDVQELLLQADPTMSLEQIEAAGQVVFMNEAIEAGDVKGFVSVSRLRLAKQAFEAEKNGFKLKYEQKDREIEQRERQMALDREKFETDAAATALKFVAELKTIAANRTLTEPARIDAARRTLFGVDPTTKPAEVQP